MKIDSEKFFIDDDFLTIFGVDKSAFFAKWDPEFAKHDNNASNFKKEIFLNLTKWNSEYITDIKRETHRVFYSDTSFENLNKYYISEAFAYILLKLAYGAEKTRNL